MRHDVRDDTQIRFANLNVNVTIKSKPPPVIQLIWIGEVQRMVARLLCKFSSSSQ